MADIPADIKRGAHEDEDKNLAKFTAKEILDKIGFGFGSQQFINILFLQTGASIFLIGLVNSLRVAFGNLISFFMEKSHGVKGNKRLVSWSGIAFGFSFLLIAVAIFLRSVWIFALAILISGIAIVPYSEANAFFRISGSKAYLTEKIIKYSLIITGLSLFISARLMDNYPLSGRLVLLNVYDNIISFNVYGYLIVFEIAAISFIAAGYILSKAKVTSIASAIEQSNLELKDSFKLLINNKMVLLLGATSIVVSLAQTIGYSYYGIFIYQNFSNVMFGGFLNVAMVFLISVFTSLIGYFITKINAKTYKKFPILIFGVTMAAFMPFAYFLKLDIIFITIGTIIGVMGSSAVGVTNSLLAIELISHNLRQAYFFLTNIASIPIFLIIAPILAYVAQTYGMSLLFLLLTSILSILATALLVAAVIFKKELA